MQVKEYKSPEEALKEVKDPIIRSAIEPLSDKVAELKKNAESPLGASFPLPSSNVRKVINSIDDVIEILIHYKKMLKKAYCELNHLEVPEVDEYLFREEIDYLRARVNAYLKLGLYKPLPHFQKLVDYSSILHSARYAMERGYMDIDSRTTGTLLSTDLYIFNLLDIAGNYSRAEEHEGKQD